MSAMLKNKRSKSFGLHDLLDNDGDDDGDDCDDGDAEKVLGYMLCQMSREEGSDGA